MKTLALSAGFILSIYFGLVVSVLSQDGNGTAWQSGTGAERKDASRRSRGRGVRSRHSAVSASSRSRTRTTSSSATILPHPAGCPRRAFCGCGAAVEVFGKPLRHLWLAASWLKFPAAAPGPGMVAARRGHVMVIRQMVSPGMALVYDANSGRGATRLHVRSLSGFRVVNPRG